LAILVGGEYQLQRHSGHENCFSNDELFDDLDYFLLLRGYPQKSMPLLASRTGAAVRAIGVLVLACPNKAGRPSAGKLTAAEKNNS